MPTCHKHPTVQLITDVQGISRCDRCEREARAAARLVCPQCGHATTSPGLCETCAAVSRRSQGLYWFAEHPLLIVAILFLLAALVAWPYLKDMAVKADRTSGSPALPSSF